MFTGLVYSLGILKKKMPVEAGLRMEIQTEMKGPFFELGQSIAVDGVCLTVESYDPDPGIFEVTATSETLEKTLFADFKEGQRLHLEPPLTLSTLLGGHLVLGHVDGLAEVLKTGPDFVLRVPHHFLKYIPLKGSATISGVSLTVAKIEGDLISFALIPETLKKTKLGELRPGERVHLEIDLIARYLESLLNPKLQ